MKKLKKVMMMVFVVGIFLVPVVSIAGSLEPSGAPAPTMKTLDQIPPTWSIKLPAADRFVVLVDFNNEAVLDKETGLVWEQSPTAPPTDPHIFTWSDAQIHCNGLTVGNRKGWRMPTVQELASLVDPTQSNPALPTGHPFSNVQSSGTYWSATTTANITSNAWLMFFGSGNTDSGIKSSTLWVWCVRGGQGVDLQ